MGPPQKQHENYKKEARSVEKGKQRGSEIEGLIFF
jgi:hypothetical protein